LHPTQPETRQSYNIPERTPVKWKNLMPGLPGIGDPEETQQPDETASTKYNYHDNIILSNWFSNAPSEAGGWDENPRSREKYFP
jgi:hypothetical protein